MPTEPAPSARLIDGRYRLGPLLGQGGMSAVYTAEHVYTRRPVAVKLLLPQLAAQPDIARRFLDEARAAARITHRHCVEVLDMGQEPDGTLYLVQELLHGMDLARYQKHVGRLPPTETLALLLPIVDALGAAHAQGILHRDVKPANIFLASVEGRIVPKLIDFGIAKFLEADNDAQQTRIGVLAGTVQYMAPEQLLGQRPLDARIDVWSVGIVLYELLTGAAPFGVGATMPELMHRVLSQPVPRVADLAPDVPPALSDAIACALEREREQRFPSMTALGAALRAALPCEPNTLQLTLPVTYAGSEDATAISRPPAPPAASDAPGEDRHGRTNPPSLASMHELPTVTASVRSPQPPPAVPDGEDLQAPPRTRWPLAALGLLLFVLVIGASAWLWPTHRPPAPPVAPAPTQTAPPAAPPATASPAVVPPTPALEQLPTPPPPQRQNKSHRSAPRTGANGAPIVN